MTDFLGCLILLLLNPLDAERIFVFSKTIQFFQLVVVVVVCNAVSCVMCLGDSPDLWWFPTVTTGWAGRVRVYLVYFSVCMLCLSTMFRVCVLTVLCGCAGAVAPGFCLGTVMTSFVGHKLCFCQVFAILGCYLFCLNFNFYGFQVLLLEFK